MNPDIYDMVLYRSEDTTEPPTHWVTVKDGTNQPVATADPALAEFLENLPRALRGFEHLYLELLSWHRAYREELKKLGLDPDMGHAEKQVALRELPDRFHEIVRLWDMKLDVTAKLLQGVDTWNESISEFLAEYGGVPGRCKEDAA